MSGWTAWFFSRILWYFGNWTGLTKALLTQSNLFSLRQRSTFSSLTSTYIPLVKPSQEATEVPSGSALNAKDLDESWRSAKQERRLNSIFDFHQAYIQGTLTPLQVRPHIFIIFEIMLDSAW
jgi:hypothetical protein